MLRVAALRQLPAAALSPSRPAVQFRLNSAFCFFTARVPVEAGRVGIPLPPDISKRGRRSGSGKLRCFPGAACEGRRAYSAAFPSMFTPGTGRVRSASARAVRGLEPCRRAVCARRGLRARGGGAAARAHARPCGARLARAHSSPKRLLPNRMVVLERARAWPGRAPPAQRLSSRAAGPIDPRAPGHRARRDSSEPPKLRRLRSVP